MEAPVIHYIQDPEIATEKTQDKRTHVTELPRGFITVRIMQLLFTITILGLSAADFATRGGDGFEPFIGMITAIVGTIIYGWIMLTYWLPSLYNYWAILAFEIFSFLLWIDGFLWLLSNSFVDYYYEDYDNCSYTYDASYGYTYNCEPSDYSYSSFMTLQNAAIAAAAFAAAEMILSFVSLIVVSVFIARHRAAGGHNKPGSLAPIPIATAAQIAHENDELKKDQVDLQKQVVALQQQLLGNMPQHQGAVGGIDAIQAA